MANAPHGRPCTPKANVDCNDIFHRCQLEMSSTKFRLLMGHKHVREGTTSHKLQGQREPLVRILRLPKHVLGHPSHSPLTHSRYKLGRFQMMQRQQTHSTTK